MSKKKLREQLGRRRSTRQMYTGHRDDAPIDLETVRLDGGTQPRERFDEETLAEYAARMERDDRGLVVDPQGQVWEPLVIYEDEDGERWLADGFHRVRAARSLDLEAFQARVLPGSRRDAVRYSLSANARHGLRRTQSDKRRAVRRALEDQEWGVYSARAVAELCAVSDYLVRTVRGELEEAGAIAQRDERVGADGQLHDVSTRRTPRASSPQKRAPKRERAQLELSSLDGAGPLEAASCVVAHASSRVHFDALADHLEALLTEGGALVVPMAREDGQALASIARLSGLVERGALAAPRWVVLERPRELVVVWPRAAQLEVPGWVRDLDALLEELEVEQVTVLRTSGASA